MNRINVLIIFPKIIISFLVLILVIVVYFLPKQTVSATRIRSTGVSFRTYLIGEDLPNSIAKKYGVLDLNETKTQ